MDVSTKQWTVRQNKTAYPDLFTYTILEPNPDAGKSGVVYSGSHFAVASGMDSKEDTYLMASAPDLYDALKMIQLALQGTVDCDPAYWTKVEKALAKAEGKDEIQNTPK